jgi:hypothetical protein
MPVDHTFILGPNVSTPILILSYHTQLELSTDFFPSVSEIKSSANHTAQFEIYNLNTFTSIPFTRLLNELRHNWHATGRPTFVQLSLKHIKSYAKISPLNPIWNISLSMALQHFVGPWPLFSFLILYPVGRTSPSQVLYLYTEQYKYRINAQRYPCFEWDSNQRPQCSSGWRRYMP